MNHHLQLRFPLALGIFWILTTVSVAESFRYPEGTSGRGELKYINGLPVLEVWGDPGELGAQIAHLALNPAARILNYPKDALKEMHLEAAWPLLQTACTSLEKNIPREYLEELDSIARVTGQPRELLLVANTMFDIVRGLGCSTLIVPSHLSRTGAPLFGRNLDYPTLGYLHEFSLVTVYHPDGKHAFVSVTFPGAVGVFSGMNDAGLALAVLEVDTSKDDAPRFDPRGVPYAMCFRKLLEDCSTVEQAERALRAMLRTCRLNLAICDPQGGAVFEITPKTVAVRRSPDGCLACTNHFRTPELRQETNCWRYPILNGEGDHEPLGIQQVQERLHRANQGELTLQTMIFEPTRLNLHLALGQPPTSGLPLKSLELSNRLRRNSAVPVR